MLITIFYAIYNRGHGYSYPKWPSYYLPIPSLLRGRGSGLRSFGRHFSRFSRGHSLGFYYTHYLVRGSQAEARELRISQSVKQETGLRVTSALARRKEINPLKRTESAGLENVGGCCHYCI